MFANPFMPTDVPAKVQQLFVQSFTVMGGLMNGVYGVAMLDRFAMCMALVLLVLASLVAHMDFEDHRWWR